MRCMTMIPARPPMTGQSMLAGLIPLRMQNCDSCLSPTYSLFHDTTSLQPISLTDPVATDLTSRRGRPTATTDGADQRQQWECGQHRAQDKDLTTIPGHVQRVPNYVHTTAIFKTQDAKLGFIPQKRKPPPTPTISHSLRGASLFGWLPPP